MQIISISRDLMKAADLLLAMKVNSEGYAKYTKENDKTKIALHKDLYNQSLKEFKELFKAIKDDVCFLENIK